MKCTFLSALIYKKPTMRETAALFTNRKWLKHAPRVLFLDCFPLSPFSTVSSLQTVCLKHSHTQKATTTLHPTVSYNRTSCFHCCPEVVLKICVCVCAVFVSAWSLCHTALFCKMSLLRLVESSLSSLPLGLCNHPSVLLAQRPKQAGSVRRQRGTDTMSMAASRVCVCLCVCVCVLGDSIQ